MSSTGAATCSRQRAEPDPLPPRLVWVRNAAMFNNEQMSDVHFIVGPPGETLRVPAHKVEEPGPEGGPVGPHALFSAGLL